MANIPTPNTIFSRDVLGRYVCNTLSEALDAQNASLHPDARPFDVILIGGGSFGGVFAQHLLTADEARRHRILILEAGPMLIGEHTQNLPMIGLGVPKATTIQAMTPEERMKPREEVWGLAWHSNVKFPGLAYCVGGRSLYWGGWSPQPLEAELQDWPQDVVADLAAPEGYQDAAEQLGSETTNDFIYGPLQNALREVLAASGPAGMVPFSDLPDHPAVIRLGPNATKQQVADVLGISHPGGRNLADLKDEAKLEAPLAVQSAARSGTFPNNKFSSVPLTVKAARTAWAEWPREDNLRRRLMLVPNCHVQQLIHDGQRVVQVRTNLGNVEVQKDAVVVIAAGTIETTRLALNSFKGLPKTQDLGTGLTAHLRSNLTIRVPRTSLPVNPNVNELSEAALFLKGLGPGGRYFHLQITAAGLGPQGNNSEAELWQKIPDVDTMNRFATASDSHVVITIRAIGEMEGRNPASFVRQDADMDYGTPRAFVSIAASQGDIDMWNTMDTCSDDVALAFSGGERYEVLTNPDANQWTWVEKNVPAKQVLPHDTNSGARRDKLGTTHHEASTLRMGTDPTTSSTDLQGRFHGVNNAYALGPATFPRLGSPNPMLTGVALSRRLARHLAPQPGPQPDGQTGQGIPYAATDGYTTLFNGMDASKWRLAGSGAWPLVDGAIVSEPGADLGLAWCTEPTPADFSLRLQFRLSSPDDNSGIFVRFPHPDSKNYGNTAWVPVDFGFEVQIDDKARPDGADMHRTGAIYGISNPNYSFVSSRAPGLWNDIQIDVKGQTYTVVLNGHQSTRVTNTIAGRGLPSSLGAPSYIGVQAHTGRVAFRNMQIKQI